MLSINDVIGIVALDGTLKYKSANIESLFGWKTEELVGLDAFVNVHPTDLVKFQSYPCFRDTKKPI